MGSSLARFFGAARLTSDVSQVTCAPSTAWLVVNAATGDLTRGTSTAAGAVGTEDGGFGLGVGVGGGWRGCCLRKKEKKKEQKEYKRSLS